MEIRGKRAENHVKVRAAAAPISEVWLGFFCVLIEINGKVSFFVEKERFSFIGRYKLRIKS